MYETLKQQLGDLSPDKEIALRAYVTATERYENAEQQIKKFGTVTKDPKSNKPIPNPYIAVSKTSLEQLTKLAKDLGIDRLSQTRNTKSDNWKLPKNNEYTPQQRLFAKHYAKTRKAGESARKAGYAENSASSTATSLLKQEKIRSLIEEEVKKLELIDQRTPEDILCDIRELTRKALETNDTKLALECLRLEGRYYGAFGEGNKSKGGTTPEVLPLYNEDPYTE